MLPMVGALLFVAILVVALLADLALLQGTYRRTASHADRIAEAAAAMLDEDRFRSEGAITVDEDAAAMRALRIAADHGIPPDAVSVDVDGPSVCVEVHVAHEPVAIRMVVPEVIDVRVRSCAIAAVG